MAAAVASEPPTPGKTSVTMPGSYDSWGRNFGAVTLDRVASFTNTGLPSFHDAERIVTSFESGNVVMANVDDVPVFGMQFDNGFSLDGMISN